MSQPVRLRHFAEFHDVLATYQVSDHAAQILRQLQLVIMLSVFAGGRNTLIVRLLQTGAYHHITSDTTRPPKVRDGQLEQNGVQYFFRSEDDVLADLRAGEYLEAELIHGQQVSGISIRELERARDSGKIPINEIDILGAATILRAKPDATMLFIVPPSYEEWQRRIRHREEMSDEEYHNRMRTAEKILTMAVDSTDFRFVINDKLDQAADTADQIVRGRVDQTYQQRARELVMSILQRVRSSSLDS